MISCFSKSGVHAVRHVGHPLLRPGQYSIPYYCYICWRWSKPNIIFALTSESRSSRVGSKSIIFCNSVASRALGSSSAVVNISIYLLARCPPVFCHINIHTCKLLDKIIILQLMTFEQNNLERLLIYFLYLRPICLPFHT